MMGTSLRSYDLQGGINLTVRRSQLAGDEVCARLSPEQSPVVRGANCYRSRASSLLQRVTKDLIQEDGLLNVQAGIAGQIAAPG